MDWKAYLQRDLAIKRRSWARIRWLAANPSVLPVIRDAAQALVEERDAFLTGLREDPF